ncbi:hypothetical protein CYMTET_28411, partial [Cymbomonas tetramitiformis]
LYLSCLAFADAGAGALGFVSVSRFCSLPGAYSSDSYSGTGLLNSENPPVSASGVPHSVHQELDDDKGPEGDIALDRDYDTVKSLISCNHKLNTNVMRSFTKLQGEGQNLVRALHSKPQAALESETSAAAPAKPAAQPEPSFEERLPASKIIRSRSVFNQDSAAPGSDAFQYAGQQHSEQEIELLHKELKRMQGLVEEAQIRNEHVADTLDQERARSLSKVDAVKEKAKNDLLKHQKESAEREEKLKEEIEALKEAQLEESKKVNNIKKQLNKTATDGLDHEMALSEAHTMIMQRDESLREADKTVEEQDNKIHNLEAFVQALKDESVEREVAYDELKEKAKKMGAALVQVGAERALTEELLELERSGEKSPTPEPMAEAAAQVKAVAAVKNIAKKKTFKVAGHLL